MTIEEELARLPVAGDQPFVDALSIAPRGLVMEFGVYKGDSLKLISSIIPNRMVYGFDSFNGLPEDWIEGGETQGHFKCDPPRHVGPNVAIISGLFKDTLPIFMEQTHPIPVSFVHIDCDLYSSTKYVLNSVKNRLTDGAFIAFDEILNYKGYEYHELKAFNEFLYETGYSFYSVGRRHNCSSIVRIIK